MLAVWSNYYTELTITNSENTKISLPPQNETGILHYYILLQCLYFETEIHMLHILKQMC